MDRVRHPVSATPCRCRSPRASNAPPRMVARPIAPPATDEATTASTGRYRSAVGPKSTWKQVRRQSIQRPPRTALGCNSGSAQASARPPRLACLYVVHSPPPDRARPWPPRNSSFRDETDRARRPTSPATWRSSRSKRRLPPSPRPAAGTASPFRYGPAALGSRAPGGCHDRARRPDRPARDFHPPRNPKTPCARARAIARRKPRQTGPPAP